MNARNFTAIALGLAIAGAGVFGAHANAGEPPNQSAVIGRPFRISESVKDFCKVRPILMMCEQAMPLLATVQSEARDPRWAAPMEALIEKSMRVGGKQWAQIRALECRSTHCALEYAVFLDDLDRDVDGNTELERLMDPIGGMVAPEVNQDSGRHRMVSVLFWTKRS